MSYDEVLNGTEFGIDPDITLVHGIVADSLKHAWVVRGDGTVHDMVTGFAWPSRFAHEQAQGYAAQYETTYTRMEAIAKACEYLHVGPWSAEFPPLVDEEGDCEVCGEHDLVNDGLCGYCEDELAEAEHAARWGTCNECGDDASECGPITRGECESCANEFAGVAL